MTLLKRTIHAPEMDVPRLAPQVPKDMARPRRTAKSQTPPEPTTLELAANFTAAAGRWAEAGFPTVSAETYAARSEACDACPFWDGKARFGLGKCKAPGCGCTSLKRWLATERCTHPEGSRWPA